MTHPTAWALLISAVLLQLFTAIQERDFWGALTIGETGSRRFSRRADVCGVVSGVAVGAAGVLVGRDAGGAFVFGLGVYALAMIANRGVHMAAMRSHQRSVSR